MTERTFATIEGNRVEGATVHLPAGGVWWADLRLEGNPELSGRATLQLGARSFVGTIDPSHNATFGLRRSLRLIGGAGGWSSSLPAKAYHNDAGVTSLEVLNDLARETGESFSTTLSPPASSLGPDYVRRAGRAGQTLESVANTGWWVELDGTTSIGTRPTYETDPAAYVVPDAQPDDGVYSIGLLDDDVGAILPGAILSAGVDAPVTVRDVRIEVSPDNVEIVAYAPAESQQEGRLVKNLRAFVDRVRDRRIWGKVRYRVIQMNGDRFELQAISEGYPDIGPVNAQPGIAGASAQLVVGSTVLVEFIEGDPALPIVVAYAEKGGPGHEPQTVTYSAAVTLKLGGDGASEGVILGNSHVSWAGGHIHGYIDSTAGPLVTTVPISLPYTGGPGTPDPPPNPSTKVLVQ